MLHRLITLQAAAAMQLGASSWRTFSLQAAGVWNLDTLQSEVQTSSYGPYDMVEIFDLKIF